MDLNLGGQVVLISGSSRGLGRAIAVSFVKEGARVVITGREKKDVRQTADDLLTQTNRDNVLSFVGDLSKTNEINRCLVRVKRIFGSLDVVVANIGSGRGDASWQADDAMWNRLFDINLFGPMRLIRASIPCFNPKKGGAIVLISSIAAYLAAGPYAYGAAKAGLNYATKRLGEELAPRAIRVNAVAPGNIFIPGGIWDEKMRAHRHEVTAYIKRAVPLGRFANPEEISSLVTFLASEKASFVTSSCVVVDGGQSRPT